MNEMENLLATISGECSKLSEVTSKALRFGLNNHHPNSNVTNAEHIMEEYYCLSALIECLQLRANIPLFDDNKIESIKRDKIADMVRWQQGSIKEGTPDDITENNQHPTMKLIRKNSIVGDEYYCEFTKTLDELCGFKTKCPNFHNYLLDTRDIHNNSLDLRVPGMTTGYIKMNNKNMVVECKIIDDLIGEGNIYPHLINEGICNMLIGTIIIF